VIGAGIRLDSKKVLVTIGYEDKSSAMEPINRSKRGDTFYPGKISFKILEITKEGYSGQG